MPATQACPDPIWASGDIISGFRLLRVEKIPEIRVTAYELIHERTGAKVLHLHCHDRENLYAIGFRTPPHDSTGLPHILEHSVLAGSVHYPVKDAFNELHRSTLQTFINAFTYPDKTIYPVASQVKADFYNLARVYTDLALRPRLLVETFRQEGHHREFAVAGDTESDLVVSGIVYNEMKGAYSSPDNLMFKALQENLFPDTIYRFDAGGAPEAIPSLTYDDFVAFHRAYYSPSNARIFLYGDIPTSEHLSFLQEMLAGFDRATVDSSIPAQKRWHAPRIVRSEYPIGKEEDAKRRTTVNMAWMMSDNTDERTSLLLQITSGILIGSAAGPLRKALIDSRLGEDLSPAAGFERDYRHTVFSVGLRGTDEEKAQDIEALILKTLEKIAEEGIDAELIEGTLHQVEFGGKEIVRSSYPYGIVLMGWAYHTWLYDGDPLSGLNFPAMITEVRRQWQANPRLFEELIQTWFLRNPHRLLSVMAPSPSFLDEKENLFRKKMDQLRAELSPADLRQIDEEAAALKDFQATPDTPDAIHSLPKLHIAQIERRADAIPTAETAFAEVPALCHDIFTNGIAYLDLAFDIAHIPEDLQPYLPLLAKFMTNTGAAGLDYEAMAKRIALKTGGIACALAAGMKRQGNGPWQKMTFRLKSLYRNIPEAVNILGDILTQGDMTDLKRLEDLTAEKRNRLHASIIPSGHLFARRLAGESLSLPAHRDEQWHGKTQLQLLQAVAPLFSQKPEDLLEKMARLKTSILRREGLVVNLTADASGLAVLSGSMADLLGRLTSCPSAADRVSSTLAPRHRGIVIPAQVAYVARAFTAPTHGHEATAALLILTRCLSNGYLYKTIRVQGGAYGGMSVYDPGDGVFAFLSYRDPHVSQTLNAYDDAISLVCRGDIAQDEFEKAVIGTIGALDRPMDPYGKASAAMNRHFAGLTDAYRQTLREEILSMTVEKLRALARGFFETAKDQGVIAVYGGDEKIRQAQERMGDNLEVEVLTS